VSGFSGLVGKLSHQRSCRTHTMSMEASPLGRGKEIFSLAPMMEYTDRHMRFMLRLMSRYPATSELLPCLLALS
jgi:hypothetical protein